MEEPEIVLELDDSTDERSEQPPAPVRFREVLAVLGLVILADLTVYRGQGFGGMAALFVIAPTLLLWGVPQWSGGAGFRFVALLLLVLAAALVWCGSGQQVAIGAALLVAFSMTLAGMRPYVADVIFYAVVTLVSGGAALC